MLPLIPAFILLLLQGAPHGERLVRDGRLPEALNAVSMHLSARQSELVLASLIAASGDRELTDALVRLLQVPPCNEPTAAAPSSEDAADSAPVAPNRAPEALYWIFGESQRSRDGPFSIA